MLVAWHPTRWCGWCMTKDEKKEKEPFLIDNKSYKVVSIVSIKINTLISYQVALADKNKQQTIMQLLMKEFRTRERLI